MILMQNTMKTLIKKLKKNPKFKAGGLVRISKSKNIFAEGYAPNFLLLVKLKIKFLGVMWLLT